MALTFPLRRTTQGVFSGANMGHLYSWDFSETAGANSITVKLYDGTDNTGIPLTPKITVPAAGAVGEDYAHPRVITSGSVFVEKGGSGTAEVVIGVA